MQDNIASIMQAGNLYVYTVNNPIIWIDPSGRVIELPGNRDQRNTILRQMQMLTNHELRAVQVDDSWHLAATLADRNLVESDGGTWLSHGNELILRMIASEHTVQITSITGNARSSPAARSRFRLSRADELYASTPGIGAGGEVLFNTLERGYSYTMDDNGISSLTRVPSHILLAHELIHADRAMRGVTIPDSQTGNVSLVLDRRFASSVTHRRIALEELATIGIGNHHTSNCITENMFRQEHGFDIRTSHRGEHR